MIVTKNFESVYIAAHTPNFIEIGEVDSFVEATYTSSFLEEPLSLRYQSINDKVVINALEITKQIYLKLKDYTDPFQYTETVLYTNDSDYHYADLNISFVDASGDEILRDLIVLNSALQVNECLDTYFYLDKRLGVFCNAAEINNIDIGFAYVLNSELNSGQHTADFTGLATGLPIFQGYPHTTSVLRDNGIERILDYHPEILPIPDLTYVPQYVKGCKGIYMKWLNTQGGYSYWLFSDVFLESKRHRSLGEVQNHWRQRGVGRSNSVFLGKTSAYETRLFSKVPFTYMREVASLLDSPEVYMYTDDAEDCNSYLDNYCGWIRVQVKDGTTQIRNSKYNHSELRVSLQFPERFVQTLI